MANLAGTKRKSSDNKSSDSKSSGKSYGGKSSGGKSFGGKPGANSNYSDKNKKNKISPAIDPNLSSSANRRAVKHERQSHRRHADVVTESKELWNKLRLKTNTKEEIVPMMEKLMALLFTTETTLREIALQHDASRVVQAAIQHASPEQRRQIMTALQGQIPEMSKIQYAHFCVLKMIQYGHRDAECVKMMLKSMKGHLCKLAVHAVGARVVELFFSTIPAKQTHALRQEFYGPHFSLFADATLIQTKTPTLQSNIDLHPDKKEAACDFVLNNLVQKGLDKGLYGFAYFQQLLSEYLAVVGHNKDLIANLVDNSLHLLSTRAGTQIVSYCVAYGTAKDRKRILKALKGYTRSSLLHRDAYLAILQVVLVTDDTVSVHKSLLAELLTVDPEKPSPDHALLQIAVHDQASKLLLLLVSGTEEVRNKFLDPLELAVLQTNPMIMDGGVEVPTSKKNHDTRRKELLQYMIRPLEQLCLQHTNQLTRSLAGSRVVQQVYKTVKSEEMRAQLVQLCVAGVEEGETSLLEDPVGHYLIKHLVSEDDTFAQALTESLDLSNLTSSRAAFVVTALCKTAQRGAVTKKVNKSKLQATMKSIKKKDEKATTAGFEALLKALNEKK